MLRSFGLVNPLEYEEVCEVLLSRFPSSTLNKYQGREMIGILLCVAWMKMTSHVSRVHFRSGHVLPAPRRLVMTSLYLSIVPVLLTLVCILRFCLEIFVPTSWEFLDVRATRAHAWQLLDSNSRLDFRNVAGSCFRLLSTIMRCVTHSIAQDCISPFLKFLWSNDNIHWNFFEFNVIHETAE